MPLIHLFDMKLGKSAFIFVYYNLQSITIHYNLLQFITIYCNLVQFTTIYYNILQFITIYICSDLIRIVCS